MISFQIYTALHLQTRSQWMCSFYLLNFCSDLAILSKQMQAFNRLNGFLFLFLIFCQWWRRYFYEILSFHVSSFFFSIIFMFCRYLTGQFVHHLQHGKVWWNHTQISQSSTWNLFPVNLSWIVFFYICVVCIYIYIYIYIYNDLVPKGVHENRSKGVENKVDDTLKLVVFLECARKYFFKAKDKNLRTFGDICLQRS